MARSSCSIISEEQMRKPCGRRQECSSSFQPWDCQHCLRLLHLPHIIFCCSSHAVSFSGPLHPNLKPHPFTYDFVAIFLIRFQESIPWRRHDVQSIPDWFLTNTSRSEKSRPSNLTGCWIEAPGSQFCQYTVCEGSMETRLDSDVWLNFSLLKLCVW